MAILAFLQVRQGDLETFFHKDWSQNPWEQVPIALKCARFQFQSQLERKSLVVLRAIG